MALVRKVILVGDRVRLPDGRIGEVTGPRDYSRSDRYPVQLTSGVVYVWPQDVTVEKSITDKEHHREI